MKGLPVNHGVNRTASLSFVNDDGTMDLEVLLSEFAQWWAASSDLMLETDGISEDAAHVILMAFLERVADQGGLVDRDYAVGRGRVDIFVRWPYPNASRQRLLQREVIEVEVQQPGTPDPQIAALEVLDENLARLGLDRGMLLVFDRDLPPDRVGRSTVGTPAGRRVTMWRL